MDDQGAISPARFTEQERVLTVAEVARALAVPRSTIYRWIRSGKLPALRKGRGAAILERDVQALIAGRFRDTG